MEHFSFTAEQAHEGARLDRALAGWMPQLTRTMLQKLCEQGHVTVRGSVGGKSLRLAQGDEVLLVLPDVEEPAAQPEDIPLDIPYEDEHLLVVNKPKGMVVHPAPGNLTGTLVSALLWHCRGQLSGIGGVARPGIVHRIDKDTSGLLIVAKNDAAHQCLAAQIAAHSFLREYRAVVYGGFAGPDGTVEAPVGRHPVDRKRMAVVERGGKPAVTHYSVLAQYRDFSALRLTLETGRTHQIRVHMAHIGHPVAGDVVYGPHRVITELQGQCLHAKVVGFTHPASGERIVVDSALPDYFERFLARLTRTQ